MSSAQAFLQQYSNKKARRKLFPCAYSLMIPLRITLQRR